MKDIKWAILLGVALISASVLVYIIHYIIFHDVHHIMIYLIGDIAFTFTEVFMVTIVIHQLLNRREKRAMLKKLNMVIGAFFSEVGTYLLRQFSQYDPQVSELRNAFKIDTSWEIADFIDIKSHMHKFDCEVDCKRSELERLKAFLGERRDFLLVLLENPNLLEHESFTELLWAVFHLMEELNHRKNIMDLTEVDYRHLTGDIKRAYSALVTEWVSYLGHLKENYPYLYSLAVRTNPFDLNASVEIK